MRTTSSWASSAPVAGRHMDIRPGETIHYRRSSLPVPALPKLPAPKRMSWRSASHQSAGCSGSTDADGTDRLRRHPGDWRSDSAAMLAFRERTLTGSKGTADMTRFLMTVSMFKAALDLTVGLLRAVATQEDSVVPKSTSSRCTATSTNRRLHAQPREVSDETDGDLRVCHPNVLSPCATNRASQGHR